MTKMLTVRGCCECSHHKVQVPPVSPSSLSLCADLKHVYLEVAQGDEDTDTSSAVGILVAPETDAIAACRVLTVRAGVATLQLSARLDADILCVCFGATTAPQQALFRADNVQYIIKPVSGFREMLLATQAIVGADEFDVRFLEHSTQQTRLTTPLSHRPRLPHDDDDRDQLYKGHITQLLGPLPLLIP